MSGSCACFEWEAIARTCLKLELLKETLNRNLGIGCSKSLQPQEKGRRWVVHVFLFRPPPCVLCVL